MRRCVHAVIYVIPVSRHAAPKQLTATLCLGLGWLVLEGVFHPAASQTAEM